MPIPSLRHVVLPAAFAVLCAPAFADQGDRLFDHALRRLHSDEVVRLAERFGGQPVLVVNTASHCGFTGQFEALEAVHRKYKARGLKVAGFPSNDFRQEAKDEAKTAEVCFENFGVTFDVHPDRGDRRRCAPAVPRDRAPVLAAALEFLQVRDRPRRARGCIFLEPGQT